MDDPLHSPTITTYETTKTSFGIEIERTVQEGNRKTLMLMARAQTPDEALTLARALTVAAWEAQGRSLAENERVVLARMRNGGHGKPLICDDDVRTLSELLSEDDPDWAAVTEMVE